MAAYFGQYGAGLVRVEPLRVAPAGGCASGEASLTATHFAVVRDQDREGVPFFVLEDDALPTLHDLAVFTPSLERLGEALAAHNAHRCAARPLHCQRTVLPYWLWPLSHRDVSRTAFNFNALTLSQPLEPGGPPLSEILAPFVSSLPIYTSSFGAAGSVCMWYNPATLQLKDVNDTKECALDLVLNAMSSCTLWPAPVGTLLPDAERDGDTDIRGLAAHPHTKVHVEAHSRHLQANMDAYRYGQDLVMRQLMAEEIDDLVNEPGMLTFDVARNQDLLCRAYVRALISHTTSRYQYVSYTCKWMLWGLAAWVLLEFALWRPLWRRRHRKSQ